MSPRGGIIKTEGEAFGEEGAQDGSIWEAAFSRVGLACLPWEFKGYSAIQSSHAKRSSFPTGYSPDG